MNAQQKKLVRKQLQGTLARFSALQKVSPPSRGWIRAIRDALGMNGKQFASRLGVKPPRVNELERDEVSGAATIKTLRRAAEALDCTFVYGFVPRTSLEGTVRERATQVARANIERVSHTMRLEDQELSDREKKRVLKDEIERVVSNLPKTLWEDARGV